MVTPKVPDTVLAPRIKAPMSFKATLLPVVMPTVLKLLRLSKVMSFPLPAASVVTPVTTKAPESVIAPEVVTPNVPDTVLAAKAKLSASVKDTLLPEVIPTVLAKVFAELRVMLLIDSAAKVAAKVVAPVTFKMPLWVMAPAVVTPKVPETVLAPRMMSLASRRLTLAPVTPTAPVKSLLALFKVTF